MIKLALQFLAFGVFYGENTISPDKTVKASLPRARIPL
jgi:hypothetical protein